MTLREFQNILQRCFPLESAMEGDNVGLQIRSAASVVRNVLCCMEVTDEVVLEAEQLGIDVIVAFHPLIYTPLKRIDENDRVGALVARCIRSGIGVYCVHTAFDAHPRGTNRILAEKLGLTPLATISPNPHVQLEGGGEVGMGLITNCDMEFSELLQRLRKVCGGPLRYVPSPVSRVTSVAIVAGSGMSFYSSVVSRAEVFITADITYHAFHAARNVIGLIDVGHYEMEQFVGHGMAAELRQHLTDCNIHVSRVNPNPISCIQSIDIVQVEHSGIS